MNTQNKVDILIIGGGIMGWSAAWWLARRSGRGAGGGAGIAVVERDPGHRHSATALSVASIRQQFTTEVNIRISLFGIDFIRNCHLHVGAEHCPGGLHFQENGYLLLSGTPAGAQALEAAAALQNRLGAATLLLTGDTLATRFPWLNTADVALASLGTRDEGWFDNMGLLHAFRRAARALGVVQIADSAVKLLPGAGGRVRGVHLARRGPTEAGIVICAAGTGAAELLRSLGEEIPVEPRKRTVFIIDAPNADGTEAPLLVCHSGFYLRPEGKHWLCGAVPVGDGPADPADFAPDLDLFERHIWPRLYRRAPCFDSVKVLSAWAGHYDYNRLDQNALIGVHPNWCNLYLANGFSGHGLQQAPAVGRGISELVLDGAYKTIDLSELAVERVLERRAFRELNVI